MFFFCFKAWVGPSEASAQARVNFLQEGGRLTFLPEKKIKMTKIGWIQTNSMLIL